MPRIGRVIPICHPDLRHRAKGLCEKCYYSMRRHTEPETMPREIIDERYYVPVRTPLNQRAVTAFPIDGCPKCHGSSITYEGRQAHCFNCGYDVWLVKEPMMV